MMTAHPPRIALLVLIALTLSHLLAPPDAALAQVGKRSPSERQVVNDKATGFPLVVLTNGKQSDAKIYPTHPQWTADGKWIVFRTSGRAPGSQAYAVNEESGDIVQLTEGPGNSTGALNLARKSMKLYFLRNATAATQPAEAQGSAGNSPTTGPATSSASGQGGGQGAGGGQRREQSENATHQIIELNLETLLADAMAGSPKPAASYERVCATFPPGMRDAGGFGLDADEKFAYVGVRGGDVGKHLPEGVKILERPQGARMGAGPGGLRSFNLETGEMKVILDTPFQMGHVQTNPFVPGEILYCWETGGDAPQRMWTCMADGSGNRPLFEEEKLDWVTHEAVVTKDEVMFNLIGHQKKLRVRPTGIAVINLRSNAVQIVGQIEERGEDKNNLGANAAGEDSYGGYWHCQGSADGKWAAGDTFGGDVWIINRRDGKRTKLTTDHKMKPDHAHPTFNADGTKILIQSGHFTDGARLSLVVIPIPKEILDTAK